MNRFLLLVGVAVVAAAMYVAASSAGQQSTPTAKQFNALKKQVASLSKSETAVKKLAVAEGTLLTACMKIAIPINQFGDPDGTGSGTKQGYRYGQNSPTVLGPAATEIFTTGLDVSSTSDTGAVWFTGGDSTCGTALGENALGHAAAKAGVALPHASLLHRSFTAHRP